jgi:glucosamine-6-phosphate deaminase
MNIIILAEETDVHRQAADLFHSIVSTQSKTTAVLALGNTPMGMYSLLSERKQRGTFDTSGLHVFQLDDYEYLTEDDDRSLIRWLKQSILDPWGIPEEHIVTLRQNRSAADNERVFSAYERAVREAGGFDIAVLGLGQNGHLGFNEPPSTPDSRTRRVTLTHESIQSSALYWGGVERVPPGGITAGLDLLLESRHLLLLVTGRSKRDILHRTVLGPVTPDVPASYIQNHPQVTILVDRAAWSMEERAN